MHLSNFEIAERAAALARKNQLTEEESQSTVSKEEQTVNKEEEVQPEAEEQQSNDVKEDSEEESENPLYQERVRKVIEYERRMMSRRPD